MQAPSYSRAEVVIPSNLDVPESFPAFTAKAIYVGGGGDVVFVPSRTGTGVLCANVPSGTILEVQAQRVRVNGTTATNLVWLGD